MEGLNYNTTREELQIPEYGRNIKNMIEYAISVADKEERQKVANAIISVMGQLNPHLRDITDYTHKLWDHLFIISNFKLDVDSPYPKPIEGEVATKPDLLTYSEGKRKIKYAYYGKSVSMFIKEAIALEDEKEKEVLTEAICNLMKKSFLTWNKDFVEDEVVFKHLKELSEERLVPKEGLVLISVDELMKSVPKVKPLKTNNKKGKNNNNNKHRYTKK
ncbi:MAG: hypothetical protein ACI8RY_000226 [Urechidicola sp.]